MYSCKNGCGYTHEHRGAMNIHENIHCNLKSTNPKKLEKQIKKECDCSDGGEWAILNPKQHETYIQQGYSTYCKKCLEIK